MNPQDWFIVQHLAEVNRDYLQRRADVAKWRGWLLAILLGGGITYLIATYTIPTIWRAITS